MERSSKLKILAVNPGTRYMGVAVLEGRDLICATVKIIKAGKMSTARALRKLEKIITGLISSYRPDILAVEKTFLAKSQRSSFLSVMADGMQKMAGKRKIPVRSYAPAAVRKFLCRDGKATRMKAAHILTTEYYPWLRRYLEKDLKKKWWEKKYWANMFDAIALGLACESKDDQAVSRSEAV